MSNFRTKYLKIACNLLWAVFLLIFVFAFLPKLLIYFMPFVVGMIFAMIANPMVKFLEKRIKINRKYGSVIMIVLVIGLVVLACYGAGQSLRKESEHLWRICQRCLPMPEPNFLRQSISCSSCWKTAIYAECGFKRHRNCNSGFFDKFCVQLRFCNAWGNRRICEKPAGYDRWHSRRTACSIFFYCR